jgi:H+/Cl- antiporter ClcA
MPGNHNAVAMPADPMALLRSKRYVVLLVVAVVLGIPISAAAYGFLALVNYLSRELFTRLPHGLGFATEPVWWPLPVVLVGGAIAAWAIKYLPGDGGPSAAYGFKMHGAPTAVQLPGVILTALATLCFGAVLGPEIPLIAIGGGLAVLAIRAARRPVPDQATAVIAATGSFAAISTLLGSPLTGAFLLMEAIGLGGPTMGLILLPGLLASGVGALIFLGLDSLTGLGTFSLAIQGLPAFGSPNIAEFGWAIVIGLAAAVAGLAVQWFGRLVKTRADRRIVLVAPLAGLVVAGLAIAFAEGTGKPTSDVLFSGENQLGPLLLHASTYTVGALVLLLACKGLAYGVSLGSFRGGPTFPALFLGAVGGAALSHVPGLPLVAGAAMGMGAMTAVILTLPLTSVLIVTLFLGSDGLRVMPLVIVAVVVAYVARARLAQHIAGPNAEQPDAPAPAQQPASAHPATADQAAKVPGQQSHAEISRGDQPTRGSRQRLVIGSRRSRPKFLTLILGPGGYWRRLYSARSTSRMTRSTSPGS